MDKQSFAGMYRREGNWTLVELKVSHPAQLFNSLDPSPFRERDLDPEAAEYLVDALRELHEHRDVRVVVYLPGEADATTRRAIPEAIRHYFDYRAHATRFDLRQLLRTGRLSLVIGLAFLVLCTLLWRFVFTGEGLVDRLLSEGFLIMGWVALWRPLEILLYAWWPLWRDVRLYRRIAQLPVEIRNATA